MARRRKGDKVDGWLVIDKPLGLSSAKAVNVVKQATKAQKVGHGGTLDPLASGILPIGLGEATKTMPYIVDASKEYAFTIRFGESTDSDDLEGAITNSGGRIPDEAEITAILPQFTGDIEQVPPAYSAVKVDGKRAYKLARSGEEVVLSAKTVQIHGLKATFFDLANREVTFHVECGKGTYVRSLARDMALALGTYGHVSMLRRLRVGPFGEKQAISLEKLEELGHSAPAASYVLPITTALDDIPAFAINGTDAALIKQGRGISMAAAKQGTIVLLAGDIPVAIAQADKIGRSDFAVRPLRVFNM